MSSAAEGERPSAAEWIADNITTQVGRTFIVTGANSGLGLETAKVLGNLGAYVIMTARDQAKGSAVLERLQADQPEARFELRQLDLADPESVRSFAATVDEVDVLINNAGVMMPPHTKTAQGYELQFAVNHLGHFALTGLLLEILARGRQPRVVTVTSALHKRGRIHFDDLHGAHKYSRTRYYAQSKLANVVFALELNRRLRAAGLELRSVLAHPGYAATNLQVSGPTGVGKLAMKLTNRFFAQSAEMGALPQLYAATSPEVVSGQLIGPDGRNESKGYPIEVEPLDSARDRELAKRLWDISEELTGVRFPVIG